MYSSLKDKTVCAFPLLAKLAVNLCDLLCNRLFQLHNPVVGEGLKLTLHSHFSMKCKRHEGC